MAPALPDVLEDATAAKQPTHVHDVTDGEELELKRQRVKSLSNLQACSSSSAFLPTPGPGETMVQYFTRLKGQLDLTPFKRVEAIEQDGLYLHKRPIRTPNGANPLAVCGSVYHHCIIYIKQGSQLHSLDYGPAGFGDVTANIMEEAAARGCHVSNASVPAEDTLPFMYLGLPHAWPGDELLTQALKVAESRKYHAMKNNCIHFADALLRLLTGGAVQGAPVLYDLLCGEVPMVDNPMVLMLQMMLQMSWFLLCDGTALFAHITNALRGMDTAAEAATSATAQASSKVADSAPVAAITTTNNNTTARAPAAAAAAAAAQAPAAAPAAAPAGPSPDAAAAVSNLIASLVASAGSRGAAASPAAYGAPAMANGLGALLAGLMQPPPSSAAGTSTCLPSQTHPHSTTAVEASANALAASAVTSRIAAAAQAAAAQLVAAGKAGSEPEAEDVTGNLATA